ncbi:MAG: heme-binding protein, partial [Actinomycetota bacterium]|nr:heme-binding protein [Actinomycetota bacterium]
NDKALHFEDGLWLSVPATDDPKLGPTVVRMASIPHGTTINAQGTVAEPSTGAPTFPAASITPFTSGGQQAGAPTSSEQNLDVPSNFRTPNAEQIGFDKTTLADINQRLRVDTKPGVVSTTVIEVATGAPGAPDHGIANTAFLGPNATTTSVKMTIWLQTLPGETQPSLLQYSQTVLLDFNGLSWPHVTVGTLTRNPAATTAATSTNPS